MEREDVTFNPAVCIIFFLFLMLVAGTSVAQENPPVEPISNRTAYKYDIGGARLEGKLVTRTFYGPSGFGETHGKDKRYKVSILKLTKPITVEPLPDAKAKDSADLDTFSNIREVQLIVTASQVPKADKMVGRVVIAAGVLHEAIPPGIHTKVWLDVKSLNLKGL